MCFCSNRHSFEISLSILLLVPSCTDSSPVCHSRCFSDWCLCSLLLLPSSNPLYHVHLHTPHMHAISVVLASPVVNISTHLCSRLEVDFEASSTVVLVVITVLFHRFCHCKCNTFVFCFSLHMHVIGMADNLKISLSRCS